MNRILSIAALLLLVITLAACAAPAAQVPAAVESEAESADTGGEATVTLRILDSFTEETMTAGIDKLNEMFMVKYPDIKIQRESMQTEDMRTVVQTTLAANEAPDIIYYDTSPGFAGVLAEADLIRSISGLYMQ